MNVLCTLHVRAAACRIPDVQRVVAARQHRVRDAARRHRIRKGPLRRAKAGACIDYSERIYGGPCTRSALAAVTRPRQRSLQRVIVGSVADGGACFSSLECASTNCTLADTTCSRSRQCCAGKCAAKPTPIPVGGDCSAPLPGQSCASGRGLHLDGSLGRSTCQVPSKVQGAACASVYDCASPLFCALDTAGRNGNLPALRRDRAPCNTVVSFGACDDLRDYCDKTTAKCTRRGRGGRGLRPAQQNCIGYTSCLGGTCAPMSPERGACDTTNGPNCLGDLECSSPTSTCGFPTSSASRAAARRRY